MSTSIKEFKTFAELENEFNAQLPKVDNEKQTKTLKEISTLYATAKEREIKPIKEMLKTQPANPLLQSAVMQFEKTQKELQGENAASFLAQFINTYELLSGTIKPMLDGKEDAAQTAIYKNAFKALNAEQKKAEKELYEAAKKALVLVNENEASKKALQDVDAIKTGLKKLVDVGEALQVANILVKDGKSTTEVSTLLAAIANAKAKTARKGGGSNNVYKYELFIGDAKEPFLTKLSTDNLKTVDALTKLAKEMKLKPFEKENESKSKKVTFSEADGVSVTKVTKDGKTLSMSSKDMFDTFVKLVGGCKVDVSTVEPKVEETPKEEENK